LEHFIFFDPSKAQNYKMQITFICVGWLTPVGVFAITMGAFQYISIINTKKKEIHGI